MLTAISSGKTFPHNRRMIRPLQPWVAGGMAIKSRSWQYLSFSYDENVLASEIAPLCRAPEAPASGQRTSAGLDFSKHARRSDAILGTPRTHPNPELLVGRGVRSVARQLSPISECELHTGIGNTHVTILLVVESHETWHGSRDLSLRFGVCDI